MAQTALLVIDVQDSFRHMPYWDDTGFDNYLGRLNQLIEHARAQGWPVIHILHERADSPFDPAGPLVRSMAGVDRHKNDVEFRKRVHNALTDSDLQPWLEERNIEKLVIAGLRTEQCCETTARVASDLGFEVIFVTDATHTFPMRHAGTDKVFTTGEIKQKTELVLENRFARIARVADFVTATTPEHLWFLLPPRVHLLDLAGPAQVLTHPRLGGTQPHYIGNTSHLRAAQGLPLHQLEPLPRTLPPRSWLLVIGCRESCELLHSDSGRELAQWLAQVQPQSDLTACICSGTLLAARARPARRPLLYNPPPVAGRAAQNRSARASKRELPVHLLRKSLDQRRHRFRHGPVPAPGGQILGL